MRNLFFTLVSLFFSGIALGQDITGNWEGKLEVQGKSIPIVFHISKDKTGKYTATFDSPSQQAYNLA
jgi:hypothetical protein